MSAPKIVLLCLEGAEFELFAHPSIRPRVPTFARLMREGLSGELDPVLSECPEAFWASALTGVYPDKHGILSSDVPCESGDGVRPTGSLDYRVPCIWDQLNAHDKSVHMVGVPATHPAQALTGSWVSDAYPGPFVPGGTWGELRDRCIHISDTDDTDQELLRALRFDPKEVDRELLKDFLSPSATIDQDEDRRPASLAVALARTQSIHNAVTHLLESSSADLSIAWHPLLGELSQIFLPYLEPRPQGVTQHDCDLYGNVIPAACALLDSMLNRLLTLMGPKCRICILSSNGYSLDVAHRARVGHGSLARNALIPTTASYLLAGPGCSSEPPFAPTVADIAPTLTALVGVPVQAGIDGRPWVEAFDPNLKFSVAPAEPQRQPNEQSHPKCTGRPENVHEMLSKLAEAHYVDPLYAVNQASRKRARVSRDINRWKVLMRRDSIEEALALASSMIQRQPNDMILRLNIIHQLFELNRLRDASEFVAETVVILEQLSVAEQRRYDEWMPHQARIELLHGIIAWTKDDIPAARSHLDQAATFPTGSPLVQLIRGECFLRHHLHADAQAAFEVALEIAPNTAKAFAGIASSYLAQQKAEHALEYALRAVESCPQSARFQLLLGNILETLGQLELAKTAWQRCLALAPNCKQAHSRLAMITGA